MDDGSSDEDRVAWDDCLWMYPSDDMDSLDPVLFHQHLPLDYTSVKKASTNNRSFYF